ncbi:MAG: hypothetical protein VYC39_12995 [Myxococcota bacterium]|nr:hypothetical protein [Myxococcota bacterium]
MTRPYKLWFAAFLMLSLAVSLTSFARKPRRPHVHEFSHKDTVKNVTTAMIQKDAQILLMNPDSPFRSVKAVLGLMKHNVKVFEYLPTKYRNNNEVRKLAISLGVKQGHVVTRNYHARITPSNTADLSFDRSDTPNGYLASPRPPNQYKKGDVVTVIDRKSVQQQDWILVKRGKPSTKEEDDRSYRDVSDVGGVGRERFSMTVDPAWIPESATKRTITADQYVSGLYKFKEVENGDMGIYVTFQGLEFAGFGAEYEILSAYEKRKLVRGDRVRIIWKKASSSTKRNQIIWTPFKRLVSTP